MPSISLDILLAIGAIIVSITGLGHLIFKIYDNKSRLKLESVYFEWANKYKKDLAKEFVNIKINLRNLSKRSTTIEHIWIYIGNRVIMDPPFFEETTILKESSKSFEYALNFGKEEFKDLFWEGEIRLGVHIIHTFKSIKKIGKTTFETGYFNIV